MAKPVKFKDIKQEQRIFTQRVKFAGFFVFIGLLALLGRYAYLQVFKYQHYSTESDHNRIKLQAVPPTRGYIYDRNGILLADNHPVFTAIVSQDVTSPDQLDNMLTSLTPILDLSPEDISRFRTRFERSRPLDEIALKIDLTPEEIARFSERKFLFPGVSIQTKMTRYYPHGPLFAHVLGYVGRINTQDAARIDKVKYAGTDLIGKLGIEKYYENLLHGVPGYKYIEADAHGKVLRQVGSSAAHRGNDLHLALDYGLQKIAFEALGSRRGAVVAIEPATGEILAFVSTPSFDPNPFIAGIKSRDYAYLRDHPDQPLYNRSLQGLYPPGSTIKPFEGMGGLHYGLVDWSTKISDPGFFHLPGDSHRFRDWAKSGHGVVDLPKAIRMSCDTFFYQLAYRMGIENMHDWMTQFGFGSKTGIDLPNEKAGTYPSPEWKYARRKKKWLPGETISVSIGQGYFTATPLQVALATAITANSGQRLVPHVLSRTTGPMLLETKIPALPHINYNGQPEDWGKMHEAMKSVVTSGTATGIGHGLRGYDIAGKTGTAQVKSIAQGKRYNEALLTDRQYDHAWFMAFAPVKNPQIAVAILVENGKHGNSAAAPIARAMFDYYLVDRKTAPLVPDPSAFGHMPSSVPQNGPPLKTAPGKPATRL